MQHLWTGGSDTPATLYTQYRVRYYIDGETTASVNIPVGFGAGEPYGDDDGPWSAGAAFGKTGQPSGLFNTFPIPFAKSINITVEIVQVRATYGTAAVRPFLFLVKTMILAR
eukprot:COSAG06_NODE_10909_length_1597_cov_2.017356_2_plen_112_part_00